MARLLPPADDVVEEEVVELVWPDLLLGALHRAIFARRHQFGRDLRVKDRQQHFIGVVVELAGLRAPADEVLDQRFRNARIDPVMAHMVAHAIGAPAERQFAQIARADHPAAMLARQPKQVIGPQAGLHILEGYIIDRFTICEGMADIFEHGGGCGADVDFFRGDPHRLHQLPRIGFGVIGSAEAGHGVAADGGARQAQLVARLGRNDQRVGAVQPARNADHQ